MEKWHNLNLLRGVGALMIVIHHANSYAIPFLAKAPGVVGFIIARIKNFGWSGIDLFFVLGGFLMANTFCNHFQRYQGINIKSYYWARAKRIIPSYYFLLFVLAITGATGWIDFSSWYLALEDTLIHLLFINNYVDQLPNGPTWYLATIVQIYLLMPLILIVISSIYKSQMDDIIVRVSVSGIFIVLGLRCWTVINGTHEANDFMLTHFRVDTVLQGMLAFCLLRMKHPIVNKISEHPYLTIFLAVLMIAPSTFLTRRNPYMFSVGFTLLALGYSMLILVLVQRDFMLPNVISILLLAVSTWSYNLYLWNYFMPRIVGQPYSESQLMILAAVNSVSLQAIIQTLMFTVIAIIVGFIMTNIIEKPAAKYFS
jgi:peptidoglycan/LPS O-acetylase OafA/YrhL